MEVTLKITRSMAQTIQSIFGNEDELYYGLLEGRRKEYGMFVTHTPKGFSWVSNSHSQVGVKNTHKVWEKDGVFYYSYMGARNGLVRGTFPELVPLLKGSEVVSYTTSEQKWEWWETAWDRMSQAERWLHQNKMGGCDHPTLKGVKFVPYVAQENRPPSVKVGKVTLFTFPDGKVAWDGEVSWLRLWHLPPFFPEFAYI